MAEIELYSAALCPYAHRSHLTLLEKGVSFKQIEIDLRNPPANFRKISPYGKVPVLNHGNVRVWESAVINEYLDEIFPDPPLLPKKPIQRAEARIWINFADTRLFETTRKLLHGYGSHQQAEETKTLIEHLHFIEQEGLKKLSSKGPYWFGLEFSLVDLTYYPWFGQWCVLEYFLNLQLPSGLERLQAWWEAVADRPSVRTIAKPKEFYIEQYAQLIRASKA